MPDKWDRFASKPKPESDQWERYAATAVQEPSEQEGKGFEDVSAFVGRLRQPKPFMERFLDSVSETMQATADTPDKMMARSRELFKKGRQEGGVTGNIHAALAPFRTELEALSGIIKGIGGVTTPGMLARVKAGEDPAKIVSDASVFLTGLMGDLPKAAKKPMTPESAMTLIRKSVLPKDPDFMTNLSKNLDTLKAAPKLTSKAQLADYLEQSGTKQREMYEKLLGPHENSTVAAKQIKGYQGEMVGDERGSATLRQLDSRLNVINNTIRDAKSGASGGPLSTEGIAPLKAEARAIRQFLYPELQKLTGVDPSPIHAKMGQLNDLARQVRASEIARFNQINRPMDAPDVTKAGFVSRTLGQAQRTALGDPQDTAIRKAFQGLRK